MQIAPYLLFDGQCEAAFTRYQQVLGGEITAMMRTRDTPMAAPCPEGFQDKIMHACLVLEGRQLMGGDCPPGHFQPPQGFHVQLATETVAEAERVFAALAEGGKVGMPMAPTFWSQRFGMVQDQFGIAWIVNGPPPA